VAHWFDHGLLKGHRTPTGRRRVDAEELASFLRAHRMPLPPDLAPERQSVLIVEDDRNYLRLVTRALALSGLDVDVLEATNGTDALVEIGRSQPAVIVFDYGLPDMNAAQVIERLMAPGRRLNAEIVVVTGALPQGAMQHLHRLGITTIVEKDEGVEALTSAVGQALERTGYVAPRAAAGGV
jgi:CheY-like chemotaxis protein